MRLAVVLPAPTAVLGGVQRFGAELANALAIEVDVETVGVHPLPGGRRSLAAARGIARLIALTTRRQVDAVVSTFHWPPKVGPVPAFGVVHDLRAFHGAGGRSLLVQRTIARTWTACFVPSAHVGANVNRLLRPRAVAVIDEGLDHVDRLRPQVLPMRDRITVIGGRAPHKRGQLGIDAARLAAATLGAPVEIVGAGAASDDRALATILWSSRVVIAPSSYEGFGLAVGEAMRCGAPVVYASDGTLRDLVGGGGVGAAPDPASMAAAAIELWQREDASARALDAAAPHSWRATADHVLATVEATKPVR